jgi:hypothetical protein
MTLDTANMLPCHIQLCHLIEGCGYTLHAQGWCFLLYSKQHTDIAINETGITIKQGQQIICHSRTAHLSHPSIAMLLMLHGVMEGNS